MAFNENFVGVKKPRRRKKARSGGIHQLIVRGNDDPDRRFVYPFQLQHSKGSQGLQGSCVCIMMILWIPPR